MSRKIVTLTAAVIVLQLLAGATAPASAQVRLQGAGATFPNPLYQRWVAEYQKINPGVQIDYSSIGSGGGIKGITDKTIDFAGSDAPMNHKEIDAAGGATGLIEVPSCAGGVVPAYNLPGVTKDINFTGEVLAEISLGNISKWNDKRIADLNPGVELPDVAITRAWRTDGSGTTFVWTNYLCTQSKDFKAKVGYGKSVKWPGGTGGKGNEGVTAVIKDTAGGFGYIEQGYADANKIPYGAIRNKAGKFVKASPKAVSLAGSGAAGSISGNLLAADIWNQAGEGSFPASSFTYLIVYKDLANVKSKEQAQALVDFLWWALHDGQKYAEELDYAPLAPEVVTKVEAALRTLSYKGETIVPKAK